MRFRCEMVRHGEIFGEPANAPAVVKFIDDNALPFESTSSGEDTGGVFVDVQAPQETLTALAENFEVLT